ncbi:alpha/beta-hydrolase, partial [Meira miltonrushii]
ILLIHGYPQTVYAMRYLLPLFAEKGFFVVAPDYRGAGGSSMPLGGYDKMTMATDLHKLMVDKLNVQAYSVLGHDIGSMVATAQALKFRDHVKALIIMECPQPGTSVYKAFTTEPELTLGPTFHFFFHHADNLPEQLTYGREDLYLQHLYDRLSYKPYFLTNEERQVYYESFRRSGRMRAGFGVYRAFRQDDKDVKENIASKGKLSIPILATGGSESVFCKYIEQIGKEIGGNMQFKPVEDASHWVPEENPVGLANLTVKFLQEHKIE